MGGRERPRRVWEKGTKKERRKSEGRERGGAVFCRPLPLFLRKRILLLFDCRSSALVTEKGRGREGGRDRERWRERERDGGKEGKH